MNVVREGVKLVSANLRLVRASHLTARNDQVRFHVQHSQHLEWRMPKMIPVAPVMPTTSRLGVLMMNAPETDEGGCRSALNQVKTRSGHLLETQ